MQPEPETPDAELQSTPQLTIVYGPALLAYDFGPEHPFSAIRGRLTFELMRDTGLLDAPGVKVVPPVEADRDELLTFHTREFVDFVQNACAKGYGFLDGGDTPAFEGCFEAALNVVGSSLKAVELVMTGQTRYAMLPVAGSSQ